MPEHKPEDARGVLPTNIHTNIVMHLNLRTLAELTIKRSSPRVQGEYREALELMVERACEVHRWAPLFLNRDNNTVIEELEEYMKSLSLSHGERLDIWKKIDQIRRQDLMEQYLVRFHEKPVKVLDPTDKKLEHVKEKQHVVTVFDPEGHILGGIYVTTPPKISMNRRPHFQAWMKGEGKYWKESRLSGAFSILSRLLFNNWGRST